MNNTFNLNRFGLIVKRQWKEFGKIYLVSLLVVTGILVLFYTLNPPRSNGSNRLYFREPLFLIVGFLFISIISSSYFANFGQKPRAIIELMLPGSVLEKFLSGVMFTAVLPTLSFLIIFHITDFSYVNYYNHLSAGTGDSFITFLALHKSEVPYPVYLLPFLVSSVFLLGSIYFNRFHYIKTACAVMIFSSVLSWVVYKVARWLFDGRMRGQDGEGLNQMTTEQTMFVMALVLTLVTAAFWWIGYVRLKEKEV